MNKEALPRRDRAVQSDFELKDQGESAKSVEAMNVSGQAAAKFWAAKFQLTRLPKKAPI